MRFCFDTKDFVDQSIDSDKLAVVGSNRELTWNDFAQEVEALCSFFRSKGWDKSTKPVIVYGHKEIEMIVAFYAMMKLEIAYIPVDTVYPLERIKYVRDKAEVSLVLNCTDQTLDLGGCAEVFVHSKTISREIDMAPDAGMRTDDPLVYIIFTSGSTGEPKGVQISTGAVRSFTKWMTSDFGYTSGDVFINQALLSFDLSVYEVMTFGALGATLLLNSKDVSEDADAFKSRIKRYNGTIWVSTPSFALIYAKIGSNPNMESVRNFLFCGETLPHALASKLLTEFPHATVYNTYGPTEATVATTKVQITQTILDQHNPLPVGYSKIDSEIRIVEGEIVIVGENVSLGYLKSPELNKARFVELDGRRAFKTGDHGYLENGMLFFNGRSDDQIKLHGYRIDLNEISGCLNDLSYVDSAETIALKRNNEVKKVVSMVRLKDTTSPDAISISDIKADMKKSLPEYMIPADIRFIESFPLNQNGKTDKKALQAIYMRR